MRILAPLLATLIACGPGVSETYDAGGNPRDGGGGNEFTDAAPPEACAKMDILFVIDDSGSMSEEQAALAAAFPDFIEVIHNYETADGDLLDYHVAATTTGRDVDYTISALGMEIPMSESGADGELLMGSGCDMPRRWLERTDGTVEEIGAIFGCVARVGTGGPSLEMPLHTTELAFTEPMASTNAGFLREDALLALVILTDENDCSRADNNFTIPNDQCDPPAAEVVGLDHYLGFLDNLKDVRGRWATVVIAGPNPVPDGCEAYTASRLLDFVDQTGDNAIFRSICTGNLASALSDALDTFEAACESFPPIP
jgi:hypothetical protein